MNKQTPSLSDAAKLLSIKELRRISIVLRDALCLINRQREALAIEETELVYQGFIAPLREHIDLIDEIMWQKMETQK
ncbi:hypothetical protein [Dielma fastidiosa]|uniref:DUF86 domain-containing protein n=1 Tax=Dielma fastidiosa TaxID=1034346 RepID=A0A318KHT1_9FIRM|nr:hypothetical protein [Dielma fastidiosa]PXX77391.1 hypothetical protein DES51_111143 [Dielma fastidiosa]